MERYSKIYSLPNKKLYCTNSPVIIEDGALLKDAETNKVIAQLKFKNISVKRIKFLRIELTCFDPAGVVIDEIDHSYLDLSVVRGLSFGSKEPIVLNNQYTRSYIPKITQVVFSDGSIWENNNAYSLSLPDLPFIEDVFSKKAAEGYKSLFSRASDYAMCEYKDLWLCVCGAVNHVGEKACYKCGTDLDILKSVDEELLCTEADYNKACSLFKNGSDNIDVFEQAKAIFCSISTYKDSGSYVLECSEMIDKLNAEAEIKAAEAERKAIEAKIAAEEKKAELKKLRKKAAVISSIIAIITLIVLTITVFIPNQRLKLVRKCIDNYMLTSALTDDLYDSIDNTFTLDGDIESFRDSMRTHYTKRSINDDVYYCEGQTTFRENCAVGKFVLIIHFKASGNLSDDSCEFTITNSDYEIY